MLFNKSKTPISPSAIMKLLAFFIVLVLNIVTAVPSLSRSKNILHNIILSEGSGTTLVLITDFPNPGLKFLINMMINSESAITIFNLKWLSSFQQQHRLPMLCPSFNNLPNMTDIGPIINVGQHNIHKRKPLVPTDSKYALTILVWVSNKNTQEAVSIFEKNVMKCKQKVEMGLLKKDNNIIFVLDNKNDTIGLVKPNTYLSNHPKVAAVYELNSLFVIWNKDLYSQANDKGIQLSQVLLLNSNKEQKTSTIFHQQKTFNGKTLHVLNIPFAHLVRASYIEEPKSIYKVFTDRSGMMMDMLGVMQDKLDFNVEFWNPDPPYEYGTIANDGSWTGGTEMLLNGKCDFIIDWGFDYERSQISTPIPYNYLDYETFASPLPHPVSNLWAITLPFDIFVWFCIIMFVPIMSIINYLLAHIEGKTIRQALKPWSAFGGSLWYSFGTLQGESITREIQFRKANGLRWSVGAWMVYCFIIGACYSSSLKSYMTTPLLVPSLNSIKDIVDGSLPWKYTMYSSIEEDILASMTDEMHKKLWDNKIALYEYNEPMHDVQNGETVRFDWLNQLKFIAATKHTTTDGKVLVNIGSEPVLSLRYQSGIFRTDVPWIDIFIDIISHISDSGLINYWESKVFREIRSLNVNKEPVAMIDPAQACDQNDGGSCPLKLEHYAGSLLVSAILLLASALMFFWEIVYYKKQKSKG